MAKKNGNILIVDDNRGVLTALQLLLNVESSGKCKISKYFYKTRFWGLKTLVFYAVYH